ncbi:hypothetical protein BOH78_5209 [Pichia kudriavzevii]|uniref:Uncharacterized protein n=1 Tax=Pichia kudriavzevii TaxID=4909 RepID=A0A099NUD1_PICKU|nr:hypothetical protein JL09_g5338 [Pichia kudriavzevii]ONH70451.1 hypothetical protein BOH78_5209 [Pichia kudriavzevii]
MVCSSKKIKKKLWPQTLQNIRLVEQLSKTITNQTTNILNNPDEVDLVDLAKILNKDLTIFYKDIISTMSDFGKTGNDAIRRNSVRYLNRFKDKHE